MKIYSFDWEEDDPIFDFELLGLKSVFSHDYDFVFYLNKYLGFKFQRVEDQVLIEKGISYNFAVFRFYHIKTKQEIELISNHSYPEKIKTEDMSLFDEIENVKVLIPEYKIFNYFLKSSFALDEEFYVTLSGLKEIYEFKRINLESIILSNLENLILPT